MFIYKKADGYRKKVLIPLWVLLWKYTMTRKHRYCHTTREIFGGVTVFFIIFLVNQTVTPKVKSGTNKLNRSDETVMRVFYTPYNNFTQRLMTKVGHYLLNNESDVLPKPQWVFRSIQLPINENLFITTDTITVVKFKTNGSLEPDLGYTINVIGGETRSEIDAVYNGFFRSIVPKEETASPYLGTLQWAIDKSYMEQITQEHIEQKVLMQAKPEYISKELRTLHKFMILCTIIAPLPFFLIHSSRLIVERRTGLRELMKLTGVCSDVLRFSHIVESTFVAILYSIPVTIFLKVTSKPLLPYSNGFVIAFTLILHFVNSASLASVTTALSQDFNHADSLGLLLYMSTFILDFLWYSNKENLFIIYTVCCVLPHAPIYLFWDEVLYLETIGQGTQFWNICRRHSKNCMSVMRVWVLFWIQLSVITALAWYLDLVRPGPYGVSKKWNFMFKKTYWSYKRKRAVNFHVTAEQTLKVERDERFFERGPRKAEVAIKVLNVTKVFGPSRGEHNVTALDSVSFDCYRGEVTMLLGAHGAGKSTLMSIVTGMYSATSGKVYIKGMDVAHKLMELREDLGLCMQKNISFRFLTVKENILFFQKLRRKSGDGLTVEQLMKKLKLTDKAYHYSSQLSRGMGRCLQVACTLASGADVLVLDEPTSGMEVEVRHHLWDLIMVLRGNKTILMTTTCLEEANALGDRIVLLNNGNLKCHGTPMFLKQAIGTSFNLSITIRDSTQMLHLIDLVDKILPDVKHRVQDIRRITFALPSKEHDKFPALFEALEEHKREFGITLMDVGMFMEEVFLEFIEEEDDEYLNEVRTNVSTRHVKMDRIQGIPLILKQIKMLIKRVHQYSWLQKYQFIMLQVVVPIIALLVVTLTTNYKLGHDRMFSHYISQHDEDDITALVYHVGPFRRRGLFDIMGKYPAVSRVYSLDIDEEFRDPSLGYMKKQTVGLKMSDNYSKIFHPINPRITSKSISMYSNIYMSIHMPFLNKTISATYEPIMRNSKKIVRDPKSKFLCLKWSVWVVFLSVLPLAPLILLCIEEHTAGTRDNHEMAGCSPIVHWFSKLLAHMAQYLAIIPVPVLLLTLLLDLDKTFNQIRFLGSLFAILLAFGPAFLAHLYFLSFILHQNVAICHVYIMSLSFGIILPILLSVLETLWKSTVFVGIPYMILMIIARFSPLFAFGVGLSRLTLRARLNAYCKLNRRMCPNLVFDDASFSSKVCCESTSREPFKYLVSYETGLYDFLNLIVQFIFYAMLVIVLENRILHYIIEQIALAKYKQPVQAFNDASVRREIKFVQEILRNRQYGSNILIADNLHKDYVNVIQRKHRLNAIKGVSFAAKLGECIAILGPHGSGKTTILKLLAGSQVMTRGNSCVDGNFIRRDRSNYIHKISLTSSTGGMDSFMTGHENLMFIAQLQGYAEDMAAKLSHLALRFMGLQPNETLVSKYSTGCLLRLSLCSTLVLAPLVALLDEPMIDIDATTRPLVAKALQRLKLEPAAVIVAEASVDWRQMQPVFSRIAIMSKGQLATIGPAAEVLAALANGYTARIKLKVVTAYREDRYRTSNEDEESSESDSEEDEPIMHSEKSVMYAQSVVGFKREFQKVFETSRCTAEHLCMLYFHIEDEDKALLYSEMFQRLEELKNKYVDVVEDYTLCSTTVEDVFWSLTHEKQSMIPN